MKMLLFLEAPPIGESYNFDAMIAYSIIWKLNR
jgi:hypothetical protein